MLLQAAVSTARIDPPGGPVANSPQSARQSWIKYRGQISATVRLHTLNGAPLASRFVHEGLRLQAHKGLDGVVGDGLP